MQTAITNAFVEAAQEVLLAETNLRLTRGKLELFHTDYVTDDITVLISLVGTIKGTALYSLSETTALDLLGRMLGERPETFDALAQSGIAEMGNVITGRACVKLTQAGHHLTISPPTLLVGRGALLSTLDLPRLLIPLEAEGENYHAALHLALAAQ
jgi:chemotaxis protein CheX